MKKICSLMGLIAFVLMGTQLISANTIHVDCNGGGEYSTIQDGIDAAIDGDTVLVADGVYTGDNNKNLTWDGDDKHILITSENGYESCIIDCEGSGNGFFLNQTHQTHDDVIEGFTIQNAKGTWGGGIKCNDTSPIIQYNRITNCESGYNHVKGPGGGLLLYKDCNAIVQNNIIDNNLASAGDLAMGGGICCYHNDDTNAQPIIRNNIIYNNAALEDVNGGGGGICIYFSSPMVENNLIYDNMTDWYGGGIHCLHGGSPIIRNNIINSNETTYPSPAGGGISIVGAHPLLMNNIVTHNDDYGICYIYGSIDIEYCDVWGNFDGDYYNCTPDVGCISENPMFVDMYDVDFHFSEYSPCIDAGIPDTTGLNLPLFDLDGNPRVVDGNCDGLAIIDMGCYEFDGMTNYVFTRITSGDIVNDAGYSHGSSWIDYDNDNDLDLFVANWNNQDNFLYKNDGDGTFTKITNGVIVNDGGKSYGSSWGDYNNDGNIDAFVSNIADQNNFLYMNNGDGSFAKITEGDIVNDGGKSNNCCWGDYNNDGFLDLFIANSGSQNNSLYCNCGDGSFLKITDGILVNDAGQSKGCCWADYNDDGYLDLFVSNSENQNNYLYCNNGDVTFTKITEGPVVNDGGDSRGGGSWGDYDNDGDLDLFVTNRLQNNFLYCNNGDDTFTKITTGDIVNDGGNSRGSSWADYDNDGYLDLFVSNDGGNNFLYKNNCDGTFTKITDETITNNGGVSVGCVWGDYDNDGDLDIFVSNFWDDNNFLYRNNGNDNNWVNIKCIGTLSNKSAIGTKVKVKTTLDGNTVWQMREISSLNGYSSQNSLNVEFGLGSGTIIDSVIVSWPSGTVQILTNIASNQFITITEPDSQVGHIYLEIPTSNVLPGDTILVPLQVEFPDYSTFTSAEIIIGGYIGSMEFVELIADSSLIGDAGWSYESNENDSINTIWMAGSEPISSEGVLIWMKFIIPSTASGFIPITLVDALFDTGIIPVDLTSGGVNVVTPLYGDVDFNGLVQAYDASMILKYLAGYIILDDLQLSVADVSLDSTVSALDATLILQYGVSIIDTLPYQTGPEYIATGDISFEDAVYAGIPIEVPIFLTNSEKIFSFEGLISFDSQLLTLIDISWSGYLDGCNIQSHVNDGECRIIGADIEPYNENGIFATLRFYVNEDFAPSDSTIIYFDRMRWNENDVMYNVDRAKIYNNFGINDPHEYEFILHQNSPNPFTHTTKIQYSIPLESSVSLKIYNIKGELVTELVDEHKDKGTYEVAWNGRDRNGNKVVSGVYFYQFISGDRKVIKRMILLN